MNSDIGHAMMTAL